MDGERMRISDCQEGLSEKVISELLLDFYK